MARRSINPSLADVTQDIAGTIPLDIITDWTNSKKDTNLHTKILNTYLVEGTVVSTDSSGLSKLSKELPLLQVMKIVSYPKDIVYKHGSAIGGKAIGIWAADNTEMFYDKSISPTEIFSAMQKVQEELADFELKIGMAIHYGKFYSLGGGLFGSDADLVEDLAENKSEGGEIMLTESFKKLLI
jgi:hypothetical protein